MSTNLMIAEAVSDEQLMARIVRKRPAALADLYDRYGAILKALAIRIVHDEAEADDLLQEIFMQIWHQAANYSAKKGKPLGWMVTLARRRAIDRLRKRQAYTRAKERLETEKGSQPESWVHCRIDDDIEMSDLRQMLEGFMDALPPNQRLAIELSYFHGMSQREIAANTGTPLGTVKTRLELGLRKLSDALHNISGEV